MLGLKKLVLVSLVAVTGFFAGADSLKAQAEDENDLAEVRKISDSTVAVLAKAILQKDSAMLGSAFYDDVRILMPGRIPHRGKPEVMKHTRLWFDRAGGWKLTTSRATLDMVQKMGGLARETGQFVLEEPKEQGKGTKWTGRYLANWRLHDKKWVLHNLLLSKD